MQNTFERLSDAAKELNQKRAELSKLGEEVKVDDKGNVTAGFFSEMQSV